MDRKLLNPVKRTWEMACEDNLGLSQHHIRELANSGALITVNSGRKVLINYDSLIAYINSGSNNHKTDNSSIKSGLSPVMR